MGGGTGLDFASFIKFLVMLACHTLSKTPENASAYNTMESKIDVMLKKWEFGSLTKLVNLHKTIRTMSHSSNQNSGLISSGSSVASNNAGPQNFARTR